LSNNNLKHLKMGKTRKPDTTKKHGYSMTFDYQIYKNGKIVTKGLKSKETAVEKSLTLVSTKKTA